MSYVVHLSQSLLTLTRDFAVSLQVCLLPDHVLSDLVG